MTMKKIILFATLLGLATAMSAQVSFSYHGNSYSTTDTIKVGPDDMGDYLLYTDVVNNSSTSYTAKCMNEKLDDNNSVTAMFICTGEQCVSGSTSAPFSLPANGVYDEFHVQYNVTGTSATGIFRLTVVDNNSDITLGQTIVKVSSDYVGVMPVDETMTLTAFPNPANSQVVVRYALPANVSQGTLMVYNMQGQTVRQQVVSESEGTVTLQVSDLPAGVYMYGLEAAGRSSKISKLVVK